METKRHLSKVLDLYDARPLSGQSDHMNANYGLLPLSGLSTQTVPTMPAGDIRPMVHINDLVGNRGNVGCVHCGKKPVFLYDW